MPLSFTVSVHLRTGPGPQPNETMSSHVSSDIHCVINKITLEILSDLQQTNKSSIFYRLLGLYLVYFSLYPCAKKMSKDFARISQQKRDKH